MGMSCVGSLDREETEFFSKVLESSCHGLDEGVTKPGEAPPQNLVPG